MKSDTQPKGRRLLAGIIIVLGLAVGGGVAMDHSSAAFGTLRPPSHGGSWNPVANTK